MIFLGPKRLPELGKGLGEGIRGFRDSLKPAPEPAPDEPKKIE
jgi:sec-independent protein translocase protein TatA